MREGQKTQSKDQDLKEIEFNAIGSPTAANNRKKQHSATRVDDRALSAVWSKQLKPTRNRLLCWQRRFDL
jgi:hypothetical protein